MGEKVNLCTLRFWRAHSSSTPDQTNTDEGLIYAAIVVLASVIRGVVSFRGPGRRAGRVFMQR